MGVDERVKRLHDGLAKAMQAENEGRHFYLMAAQNTKDAQGKEVFEQLADEEQDHFNFLQAHYKAVKQTGNPDQSVKLAEKKFNGDHPIFSDELKKRIGSAHYEMTALSIGVQLELSAVNFYRGEAKAAEDHLVKDLYNELAAWEEGHLNALRSQVDSLKEDYWNEGGFSPF
ncbi:MAG: ferritin family protein [Planctomycetes bacterium]|nr:ferritin family protein [Planctomycetota bacterium]